LAIVRDIVESHGGTVFAVAREGGGSTVGFTLPTLSEAAPPSTKPGALGPPIAPVEVPAGPSTASTVVQPRPR
jgi:hypothetical protein